MSHYVYTVWEDRTPVYVGCTNNVPRRMKEHALGARRRWNSDPRFRVEVFEYDTQDQALIVERVRIQKLRPTDNLRDNPRHVDLLDRMWAGDYPAELLDRLAEDRQRIWHERRRQWHEDQGFTYTPVGGAA